MSFDTVALWFGAFMAVPGIIFMVKFKVLPTEILLTNPAMAPLKAGPAKKEFPLFAAVACYYMFLVGGLAFTVGMYHLGLALDVPPALVAGSVLPGMISILLYMAIRGESITGIPGVYGPPKPARVALVVIGLVLVANLAAHIPAGDVDRGTWNKVIVLMLASVGIPHALAAKARAGGWNKFDAEMSMH